MLVKQAYVPSDLPNSTSGVQVASMCAVLALCSFQTRWAFQAKQPRAFQCIPQEEKWWVNFWQTSVMSPSLIISGWVEEGIGMSIISK